MGNVAQLGNRFNGQEWDVQWALGNGQCLFLDALASLGFLLISESASDSFRKVSFTAG